MIKSLYTYAELTPEVVTNLYLYGSDTKPTNLLSDSLARKADTSDGEALVKVNVDMSTVMGAGHGRFAYGSNSPLVENFLRKAMHSLNQSVKSKYLPKVKCMQF